MADQVLREELHVAWAGRTIRKVHPPKMRLVRDGWEDLSYDDHEYITTESGNFRAVYEASSKMTWQEL